MAYLDFQPQETPDRDWGRQHFIRLRFAVVSTFQTFYRILIHTWKKNFYKLGNITINKISELVTWYWRGSFCMKWIKYFFFVRVHCSVFAISSDATSSLERLKSARSQRRKIGGILGNCGVNNDRAVHGYWRHAPAAWAWHGASLSTNNLQWCHSCPGGSETAWCLHICNLYTKLELGFKVFTSSKIVVSVKFSERTLI